MPSQVELLSGLTEVLMRPACQFIDFSYHGFRVSGQGYQAVLAAAVAGKIHLVVSPKALPDNALAGYDMKGNTIYFAPDFSFSAPRAEVTLVHECTHASFDVLYKGARMSTLHNEALAYLAMTIFNNLAPPHVQDPVKDFTGLWTSALSVAPKVKRGDAIDEATMTAITNVIMNDPRARREFAKIPVSEFDGV